MLIRIACVAAALVVVSQPTIACSLTPGSFIRSNFELVDNADAIAVAKAISRTKTKYGHGISFEVIEVLKGSPMTEVYDQWSDFGKPTPSDPKNILTANDEAFRGPCNRGTYRKGDQYVLMLQKNKEEKFVVAGDPFSRINEDHFGRDSWWRRTIAIYLNIQKNPDRMMQIKELEKIARAGVVDGASVFETQLGNDVFNHLYTVHPDKPTQWLLDRYKNPEAWTRGMDDFVEGTEEETVDNLMSLVYGEKSPSEDVDSFILRALAKGNHPEAEPVFRSVVGNTDPEPTELGAALAFFIRKGEYDYVKMAFGEHALWVEAITGPGAGPGFWITAGEAVGYGDNLKVPTDFNNWWDRQRTASCFLSEGLFDCGYDWEKAALLLSAPRRNKKLLLAGASSPRVVVWAEREVERLLAEGVETFKSDWDFPVKLLLAAYTGDKPKRIHEMACGSVKMRENLASLLGSVPDYHPKNLLREMMAMSQHEHVRNELLKSAILLAATDMEEEGLGSRSSGNFVIEYARSDGPLAMESYNDKNLPCYE